MPWSRPFILAALAILPFLGGAGAAEEAPTPANYRALLEPLPEPLVTYGLDEQVTRAELAAELAAEPTIRPAQLRGATLADLRALVRPSIERILRRRLLADLAARDGIRPDRERALQEVKVLRERLGERAFAASLAEQQLTMDGLLAQVMQKNLCAQWIEEKVAPSLAVSDDELAAAFAAHGPEFAECRVSHILIAVAPGADPRLHQAALERLTDARARIIQGANFADLAAQLSDCPSKAQGGDLGVIGRGQLVPELEEAVFQAEVGKLGEVVTSRFGYHLLKVTERRTTLPELREKIRRRLQRGKAAAEADRQLAILIRTRHVQYR